MTTATLDKLREREVELKAREKELAEEFRTVPQDRNFARRRDELRRKMAEVSGELMSLSPEVVKIKEQNKKERLDVFLGSREYEEAIAAGLEALAAELLPWLPVLTMSVEATRQGLGVPLPPASKAGLYLEAKRWLDVLIRRGLLAPDDVPPALRSLVKE